MVRVAAGYFVYKRLEIDSFERMLPGDELVRNNTVGEHVRSGVRIDSGPAFRGCVPRRSEKITLSRSPCVSPTDTPRDSEIHDLCVAVRQAHNVGGLHV